MQAVEQWERIEDALPAGWEEARLSFTVEDPKTATAAASVLAPLGPGRSGDELRFQVHPSGLESLRNLLRRLDRKRIWGELALAEVRAAEREPDLVAQRPTGLVARPSLVTAWDEALRKLPPDWTDLLCELEVDSSDFLPRAALLGAPLNPTRNLEALAFRFRVSRRGYGAAPSMARRCLERMDAEALTGRFTVLDALSDVGYASTLGPVWRIAGRSV